MGRSECSPSRLLLRILGYQSDPQTRPGMASMGPFACYFSGSSLEPTFIFSCSLHCPAHLLLAAKRQVPSASDPPPRRSPHSLLHAGILLFLPLAWGTTPHRRAYIRLKPYCPSSLTASVHDSNQVCEALGHMLICFVVCLKPDCPQRMVGSQGLCVT